MKLATAGETVIVAGVTRRFHLNSGSLKRICDAGC